MLRHPSTIFSVSMLFCMLGVLYALCIGCAADGQRGGAIGVAISFFVLFVSSNLSETILKFNTETDLSEFNDENKRIVGKKVKTLEELNIIVTKHGKFLESLSKESKSERNWLVSSSVISTFFWGFGDYLAITIGATTCQV